MYRAKINVTIINITHAAIIAMSTLHIVNINDPIPVMNVLHKLSDIDFAAYIDDMTL